MKLLDLSRLFREAIYNHSPIFIQNLLLSAYGACLHRQRYHGAAGEYTRQLLASQWFQPEEFEAMQIKTMRLLLKHCADNVPYYQKIFKQIGFNWTDFTRLEHIKKLPFLEKSTLQQRLDEFLPIHPSGAGRAKNKMVAFYTSGTTGQPLTVYKTITAIRQTWAFLERFRTWAGVKEGDRRATFSGRLIVPPNSKNNIFWRYNAAGNQMLFSSYHLSEKNLPYYIEKLNAWQPVIIDGYPSAIYLISKYIVNRRLACPAMAVEGTIKPKAVLVTAETLLPFQREAIETAFQAKVFNQYSSSEGAVWITECEKGGLHLNPESGILEILINDTDAPPDREGEIVISSFLTEGTPLIRYKIGDYAVRSTGNCPCGRKMPLVSEISGRKDDYIYTETHGYVGRLDPLFKGLSPSILETQIIQENKKELLVKMVTAPDFKKEFLAPFVQELKKRVGEEILIKFDFVNQIPRDKRGKFKSVVSKINSLAKSTNSP
ncbi:MAG: hypothetical protein AAB019_10155 [Planctomycetota bacterium]